MCLLKRSTQIDGRCMGDVIPSGQLRSPAKLTPSFGKKADSQLMKENSFEYSDQFWLARYFDKETFFALH